MQDFIYALFDFAETNNSNTNLSDAALRSLVSLGVKKPKMFINAVHTFLLDNGKKMNEKDKAFAFCCLTNVFNQVDVVDVCDEQQMLLIANLSTQEMSMAKDVENGLAHAAKDVFVSLVGKSDKFVNHVVDSLLHKFQPGSTSPPHRFIILTLSEIAQKNPDVKEFIWTQKRQTNEMEVKSDECVAVDESEISESYADQFETAYDVIINWTTSSKDHK
uniref:MROH2B-like N-terminal HEAT-repeats domain-containing protein n=1 Tax=Meloidogyne javanica TaxID=6303 RepID=A0A915M743_MELJA